jgi:hypothetical protein
MKKKLFSIALAACFMIFAATSVFATNELQKAGDGIRNVVGGAENAVEGAAKGTVNAVENAGQKAGAATRNTMNNAGNAVAGTTRTGTNNDGYTATRTATNDATFAGMNSTAWTWLVMGISAIAIIALVWYYASEREHTSEKR